MLFYKSNYSVKKNDKEDISINSNYIQNLCLYLGFENYNAFLKKNSEKKNLNDGNIFFIIFFNGIIIEVS